MGSSSSSSYQGLELLDDELIDHMVERSQKKTELLKGYGDNVLHSEELEKELDMSKKHSTLLLSNLDTTLTHYHNEVQEMEPNRDEIIRRNKALRQKNKGMTLGVVVVYLFC
jgi:hypothetical protein